MLFYRLQRVLGAGGWSPASGRSDGKHFGVTGRDGRQAAAIEAGKSKRFGRREAAGSGANRVRQ